MQAFLTSNSYLIGTTTRKHRDFDQLLAGERSTKCSYDDRPGRRRKATDSARCTNWQNQPIADELESLAIETAGL